MIKAVMFINFCHCCEAQRSVLQLGPGTGDLINQAAHSITSFGRLLHRTLPCPQICHLSGI